MLHDARARDFAEVDAHVESVRLHHGGERGEAAARELPQIRELLVRQALQVGDFLVRHGHQMPADVGITVQQREARAVAHDDQIFLVVGRLRDAREQTFCEFRLGRQNVFDAPRRVECVHAEKLKRAANKRNDFRVLVLLE